jgi:hypothetical protein
MDHRALGNARRTAHEVFDVLWQNEGMGRSQAYAMLALVMGMTREDCHMSLMDQATAERVPAAVENIRRRRY